MEDSSFPSACPQARIHNTFAKLKFIENEKNNLQHGGDTCCPSPRNNFFWVGVMAVMSLQTCVALFAIPTCLQQMAPSQHRWVPLWWEIAVQSYPSPAEGFPTPGLSSSAVERPDLASFAKGRSRTWRPCSPSGATTGSCPILDLCALNRHLRR